MRAYLTALGVLPLALGLNAQANAVNPPAVPIALVTDIEGPIARESAVLQRTVNLLDELHQDDRLRLPKNSRLVFVYLESGEEVTTSGPATLVLEANGVRSESGATPQTRHLLTQSDGTRGRLRPLNVAQLSLVMRSPTGTRVARYLHDTKTLATRPYFHWDAPEEEGLRYRFTLTNDIGEILWETVTTPGFRLPPEVSLEAGITYGWEAEPLGKGTGADLVWGSFELADAELRAQARRLRPSGSASFSERVVYATWLQQNGLRDAARRHWSALARLRDDPRLNALAETTP